MLLMQNKGGRKPDKDAWNHAKKDGNKFTCNYCSKTFTGGVYRLRAHIERIPGRGIHPCSARKPTVETATSTVATYEPVNETTSLSLVRISIPDIEAKVEEYMLSIRDSWSSTGCTALGFWDHDGPQLSGITVYSLKGLIYLCYPSSPMIYKPFLKEIIQQLCHLPSNKYSTLPDGSVDFDAPWMTLFSKSQCNICSHSIILCILNKMYEENQWLHHLLIKADNIVRESENIFPVLATPYENPFSLLQLVIKNKTEIQRTLVDELDDRFLAEGKEVVDAIGPLVQILHVFETFVPNIGYLYEAFDKAQKRIHKLPPIFEALKKSFKEMKDFSITDMHFAAACLNPAYMFYNPISDDLLERGLYYMNKHLVVQSEKLDFKTQLLDYVNKDSSLFTDWAITNLKTLHPVQWWENFGVSFHVLKRYAIQLLSQQSNCLAHTLLHKNKFKRLDNIQTNGKFMKDFNFGETILKPIDLSMIDAPLYS